MPPRGSSSCPGTAQGPWSPGSGCSDKASAVALSPGGRTLLPDVLFEQQKGKKKQQRRAAAGCPHIRRRLRAEPHGTGAGHPAPKRGGAETTLGGLRAGRGGERKVHGDSASVRGAAWDRIRGRMLSTHPCGTAAPGGISGVPPAKRGAPLLPLGSFGWLLGGPPTPLPLPRQEVPGCSETLWAGRKSPRGLFGSPSLLAATYAAQKPQPCPVPAPEHAAPVRPPGRCRYLGAPGWHRGAIGVWAAHLGMGMEPHPPHGGPHLGVSAHPWAERCGAAVGRAGAVRTP